MLNTPRKVKTVLFRLLWYISRLIVDTPYTPASPTDPHRANPPLPCVGRLPVLPIVGLTFGERGRRTRIQHELCGTCLHSHDEMTACRCPRYRPLLRDHWTCKKTASAVAEEVLHDDAFAAEPVRTPKSVHAHTHTHCR